MGDNHEPKFFNNRQYKIFIKVVDAMVDTPSNPAISAEDVAKRTDKLLSKIDAPAVQQLKTIMWLVNWLLPLQIMKPGLFVNHDKATRQKAIKRVIQKRGIYRDIARGLKMLSTVAYYSSEAGKKEVGYVDFDERPSAIGRNQDLITHPDIPIV